jgi:hypothetical protein
MVGAAAGEPEPEDVDVAALPRRSIWRSPAGTQRVVRIETPARPHQVAAFSRPGRPRSAKSRYIIALRVALRTGEALDEAVAAMQASDLDATADAGLKKGGRDRVGKPGGAIPPSTAARAELAELMRRRTLGLDQAKGGRFIREERLTALRVESERGVMLSRSTGVAEDWVDQYGRTYDAGGSTLPAEFFDQQRPNLQEEIRLHLQMAQSVPVDVAKLVPAQIAKVRDFIAAVGPRVFTVGG